MSCDCWHESNAVQNFQVRIVFSYFICSVWLRSSLASLIFQLFSVNKIDWKQSIGAAIAMIFDRNRKGGHCFYFLLFLRVFSSIFVFFAALRFTFLLSQPFVFVNRHAIAANRSIVAVIADIVWQETNAVQNFQVRIAFLMFFFSGVVLFFASLFWSLTPLFFCELTGNSCKLIVCCSNCYNFWQETNAMQNLQVGVAFLFCFFVCCDFVSLRFAFLISQPFYSLLPFTFTDRACQFYCQFYWYLTNHCLAFALNIHSILPALKMRRRPSRGIPSLNSQSYHRITLTSCRPAPGTALERASLTSRRILAPGHSALQQMQHTPSHLQLLNLQHHAHADEAPAPCTPSTCCTPRTYSCTSITCTATTCTSSTCTPTTFTASTITTCIRCSHVAPQSVEQTVGQINATHQRRHSSKVVEIHIV